MFNPSSVVIIVPVAHHIEPVVDETLRKLEVRGFTVWRKYGFSAIDQGRCVLAQEALDLGFEHLFWVDADVSFCEYDVDKLINSGKEFITAPYSVKGWPALTTKFVRDGEIKLGKGGCIEEVKYAATGFMYTHKTVYEKIISKFNLSRVKIWGGQYEVYPFFLPLIWEDHYLGEDFAFCYRAREAGIKLYSDTTIRLSHIGKYAYSFNYLRYLPEPEVEEVKYIDRENKSYS